MIEFLVSKPKRVCHYNELINCVAKHEHVLVELHYDEEEGRDRTPIVCYCLQNCITSNVNIDSQQSLEGTTDLLGSIGAIVILRRYPVIRYKRKILFSFVDLLGNCKIYSNFQSI